MIIRAAKEADHLALAELFLAARKASFTWGDPESFALGDFDGQTEGEVIHVAEDEHGRILGFISVWEAENFIHHLFVSPDHMKRGIGKALLEDLAKRRSGPFTLKCVLSNRGALAFYRKLGWRETGSGTTVEGRYLLLEWQPIPQLIITRRPGNADDLNFLWELHVLTMQDYAARTWGWDQAWQEGRFRESFDPSKLEILEVAGDAIGTLSVVKEEDHVFLRLIEIHPAWQNRGIGTIVVAQVVTGARERDLPVRLQVLKVNPARRFYERHGFRVSGETGTHFLMEHAAGSTGEVHDRLDDRGDNTDRSSSDGESADHPATLRRGERQQNA